VAILAQFEPLEEMKINHLFRLWLETSFLKRYPEVQEYGELPPFFERFGDEGKSATNLPQHRRPMLRLNLRNPKLDEQFQYQRDRAGFYWQRGARGREYPRFPYALKSFWRDFDVFESFVAEHRLGAIRPNQCAVSYNNRFTRGNGWKNPEDLAKVITFLSNDVSRPPKGSLELEQLAVAKVFRIHDNAGKPRARLYMTLGQAADENPDEMDLEFVVRGEPVTADKRGMQNFYQMAHDHIVDLFEVLTTSRMHKLWGKQ
jgi:uncharacterized protein (TIGR04255 family)